MSVGRGYDSQPTFEHPKRGEEIDPPFLGQEETNNLSGANLDQSIPDGPSQPVIPKFQSPLTTLGVHYLQNIQKICSC